MTHRPLQLAEGTFGVQSDRRLRGPGPCGKNHSGSETQHAWRSGLFTVTGTGPVRVTLSPLSTEACHACGAPDDQPTTRNASPPSTKLCWPGDEIAVKLHDPEECEECLAALPPAVSDLPLRELLPQPFDRSLRAGRPPRAEDSFPADHLFIKIKADRQR